MRKFLVTIFTGCSIWASAQTGSVLASVKVSAVALSSPPKVTLTWTAQTGTTGYTVYRKTKAATSWTQIATPLSSATTCEDATAAIGTYYEYKIARAYSGGTGYGYVASGIQLPVTDVRGKMILLYERGIGTTLAVQIGQLVADLRADGWIVLRDSVYSYTTVAATKAIIVARYNADPTNVKALFILGHVPVPYSGLLNPDGHSNHYGAWPCDGYYGDMDGTWTDNTVNNTSSSADGQRNWNVPGDTKFDQNNYPSALELMVGRVDLWNMESFQYYAGLSESQLLSMYLTKAHDYKTKAFTPTYRGIVFDNFDDVPEPIAACGYRSVTANVTPALTTDANPNGVPFSTYIDEQSYLWSYFSGGGTFVSAANVMSTGELAQNVQMGGVFNMSFGSYFGDWDCQNNFLRAPLCSGNGLTNCWGGFPYWWFHHMAMGDPVGYGSLVTMNNSSLYTPVNAQGTLVRCHLGLMGDPSLRSAVVAPPSGLIVTNSSGFANFTWTAATGSPLGYHIYDMGATSTSTPVRLTSNPINATTWGDGTIPFVAGRLYMVRAVKLETSATGTYYNMSQGAFGTAPATQTSVAVKAFLGGPYSASSGLMSDAMRVAGVVPTTDPYPGLGYVYSGGWVSTPLAGSVLAVTGNNAIVDWVILEFRNPAGTTAYSRAALIQKDGDVVGLDGVTAPGIPLSAGNYYVALKHRNHLGIMTGGVVNLTSTPAVIDFTLLATSTYGTNPRKSITGTFPAYVLWDGDVNGNFQLKYNGTGNDKDLILVAVGSTTPNATVPNVYSTRDVNMDAIVKYNGANNDRDPILVNVGSTTPNNVVNQQIP